MAEKPKKSSWELYNEFTNTDKTFTECLKEWAAQQNAEQQSEIERLSTVLKMVHDSFASGNVTNEVLENLIQQIRDLKL
jgi:uncharacterized membrane protein